MKIQHDIATGMVSLCALTNYAQDNNLIASDIKIPGNCAMWKKPIENAGASAHAKVH